MLKSNTLLRFCKKKIAVNLNYGILKMFKMVFTAALYFYNKVFYYPKVVINILSYKIIVFHLLAQVLLNIVSHHEHFQKNVNTENIQKKNLISMLIPMGE